jgi:hypothetical protein
MHKRRGDLQRVVDRFRHRQPAVLVNQLANVRTGDELERNEVQPLVFTDVVHARDVLVIELRRGLCFVLKALHDQRIARHRGGQNLQRHHAVQTRVERFEHSPHAAGTNALEDRKVPELDPLVGVKFAVGRLPFACREQQTHNARAGCCRSRRSHSRGGGGNAALGIDYRFRPANCRRTRSTGRLCRAVRRGDTRTGSGDGVIHDLRHSCGGGSGEERNTFPAARSFVQSPVGSFTNGCQATIQSV